MLDSVGQGWASRAFFSDDGSTAVEVALKMAFRKFLADRGATDWEVDDGPELGVRSGPWELAGGYPGADALHRPGSRAPKASLPGSLCPGHARWAPGQRWVPVSDGSVQLSHAR